MELSWSRWFHCESSFGLLLVPEQPGIFAFAEEVTQPTGPSFRRMLAVLDIGEGENVAQGLSRLFAPGSRWHDRLRSGRYFVRYAVVADPEKRRSAAEALRNWLSSQMDAASQIFEQVRVSAPPQEAPTAAERAVDRVMAARPLLPAREVSPW